MSNKEYAALIDAVGPQTPQEEAARKNGTFIDETTAIGLQAKADVKRTNRVDQAIVQQDRLKKQQEALQAHNDAQATKVQTEAEKLKLKIEETKAHFNR